MTYGIAGVELWPALPVDDRADTRDTLHMLDAIVAASPPLDALAATSAPSPP